MNLHRSYRLPFRFGLSLHQLQLGQSINVVLLVFLRCVVEWHVVGRTIVNNVLLSNVLSSICQTTIGLVPWIGIEIMHLVVDPGRHRIVKRLVVHLILVITTGIQTTMTNGWYLPVILILR